MREVFITASAVSLPGDPVGNDDMERILGQAGERPSRARRMVLRSNRIKSRHYAIDPATGQPTHNNAQLTAEAVRALGHRSDDAELLVCGTSMPDQVFPNHAVMVQGELGLSNIEAVATSGVCLSSVTALKYAYAQIASGMSEKAITTGSETASSILRGSHFSGEIEARVTELEERPEIAFEKDFLRWMLSDGAGALLVEADARGDVNLRIDWIDIHSFAGEMEACMYCGADKRDDGTLVGWSGFDGATREARSIMSVKQDVKLLNEHVVPYTMGRALSATRERHELTPEAIDWFLPHYSSHFFRERVATEMDAMGFSIPGERWFTNLYRKGNTGSASIIIMLEELMGSGKLEAGQTILCWVPESGRFSAGLMHLTVV